MPVRSASSYEGLKPSNIVDRRDTLDRSASSYEGLKLDAIKDVIEWFKRFSKFL